MTPASVALCVIVTILLLGAVWIIAGMPQDQRQGYRPVDAGSPGPPPTGGTVVTPRPVYHRQPKKNRRDALKPCSGVAFMTTSTDGVVIPEICQSCGQQLQIRYLDFSQVVNGRPPVTVARPPRHYGAKGTPITEIER